MGNIFGSKTGLTATYPSLSEHYCLFDPLILSYILLEGGGKEDSFKQY